MINSSYLHAKHHRTRKKQNTGKLKSKLSRQSTQSACFVEDTRYE